MKLILKMEMSEKDLKEISKKEIKEELEQMLFEVCEDWVLRGQRPDLKVEE